jgi:DNA-directed RNA polymerase beta' subunit
VGSTVVKKGNTITSNINASSKKTQAELDAIKNKKLILDDNKAADQAFKDMDADIANKKKEKKDFSKMTTKDFKKMTLEEKLELHRRMKDLGVKGKTFKKGGIVRSAGLARRKR